MTVRTHLNFCFNMVDFSHYEKIEESIEKLFPNIKTSFDYEIISATNPRYIHEIKNYCEDQFHFRPLVEEIKDIFKQTVMMKNISIKKKPIPFDYDFANDVSEEHIGKIKNMLQQNKYHTYEERIGKIKNMLQQNKYHTYKTHPNVFLLAKHEEYKKNILIFVSNQKYKKQLEIRFEDLQHILNIFKWFCENDHGQALLNKSLTICGWDSKDPPEIRQNALKRKIITHRLDRTIRVLQWCEKNPNIDPSKIKKDLVWIKQNEENFIGLKKLILFNAKEIISNKDLFSKGTPLIDEALIDLVFVLNISKN